MHLFAGIGGGLLADRILGHTPVVAVEWDGYACQVLRERAAEGWFPGLHVWEGDVRLFDPSEYAGQLDCIHAGFPCQDISVAGKQAGVSEGTRSGLYREVLRIAGVVRPRYLYLENVAAILGNGLGTVLADLAAMGYDSRWCCIRASDVGAPHHRDRWFLLAANADELRPAAGAQSKARGTLQDFDGHSAEKERGRFELNAWLGGICAVADSKCVGRNEMEQPIFSAADGWRLTNKAEQPSFTGGRGWWEVEPGLGRVVDDVSDRVGQLKGYGNAQVPLQAATAWKLLGGP